MLKTDYKDDVFEKNRMYQTVDNKDGTFCLIDVTEYSQEGDAFGAKDINATNEAINQINHTEPVTLTASGWTKSAPPYVQTVAVPGATEDMEAILVSKLEDGASVAVQKAYIKAFGIISSGTAMLGNGTATFKVYKKPAMDIVVGLKGV